MEARPEPLSGLDLTVAHGFRLLETCRPTTGYGVLPIPVLAMHEWFDRYWPEEADRDLFVHCWLEMDAETCDYWNKKLKSDREAAERKSKAPASAPTGGRQTVPKSAYPR